MSALLLKVDIGAAQINVGYGPKADMNAFLLFWQPGSEQRLAQDCCQAGVTLYARELHAEAQTGL